jgi:hypothetical protein
MSEELKLSASNFGFDANWIADVLTKYGDQVLALVVEAARNGFSVAFVVEVLSKFGPTFLEFLVSLITKKNSMNFAATNDVVNGDVIGIDASVVEVLIEKYLPQIIEKYLPVIFEKYSGQIMQFVIQMILNAMKPKQ